MRLLFCEISLLLIRPKIRSLHWSISSSSSSLVSDRRWIIVFLFFFFYNHHALSGKNVGRTVTAYMNGHWANLCILTLRFSTFLTSKRLKTLLEWNKKHIQGHAALYPSTKTLRKNISRPPFIFFIREI